MNKKLMAALRIISWEDKKHLQLKDLVDIEYPPSAIIQYDTILEHCINIIAKAIGDDNNE
tara:strand:+ start:414 stop:593 length:180 start_codon:yes stop_codon:yes gene_type:complete